MIGFSFRFCLGKIFFGCNDDMSEKSDSKPRCNQERKKFLDIRGPKETTSKLSITAMYN